MDLLRGEVEDLRTARESDAITLSLKDQELRELRSYLDDVRAIMMECESCSAIDLRPVTTPQGPGIPTTADAALAFLRRIQSAISVDQPSPNSDINLRHGNASAVGVYRQHHQDLHLYIGQQQQRQPTPLSAGSALSRRQTPPYPPSLLIDTAIASASGEDSNTPSGLVAPAAAGVLRAAGNGNGAPLSATSSASTVNEQAPASTTPTPGTVEAYINGGNELAPRANVEAPGPVTTPPCEPANEDPLTQQRRRPSLASSGSASSAMTAHNGGGSNSSGPASAGLAGVKSIWGPPLEASLASMGLYQQDLNQSPAESFSSENTPPPQNDCPVSLQNLSLSATNNGGISGNGLIGGSNNNSSATLNQCKNLWLMDDGMMSSELMGYDGSAEMYGMMADEHYGSGTISPTRMQQLGLAGNTMDRHTVASFHYLVDKIVKTNDQPASLLLQQKLKTGTPDMRSGLFEAVRSQALPLIRNRFGNFLMQRCLEHGTAAQVRVLAGAMVGHIYALSCDRFGCHVVQKALDVCEDDVKLQIISELLRAIPETITHRFACHVWQRVFETRWTGVNHRPRVAQRVDAALKSQWHLVANDENGSLVVQCVFENCDESDKAGIVREVLAHTVEIARGQWGNWVIQHLLEHGSTADKQHILKVVARHVYSMSIDQFASKVVEKGLKTCQRRDLYDIVDMVLSPSLRDSGPGILDMMNNQYANYVVQHILTLSDPNQRDACARLIAPHLPILRGSKYGQRVAAIVEKHIRTSQQRFGTILSVTAAQHAAAAAAGGGGVTGGMMASASSASLHNLAAASMGSASGTGGPMLMGGASIFHSMAAPNWGGHHGGMYTA
ncbi:hypothetical protein HK101_011616 [Irineochytrium annulatum]|nr:hypothetical protein HK101_011616 [Irineochytrium annulatum]